MNNISPQEITNELKKSYAILESLEKMSTYLQRDREALSNSILGMKQAASTLRNLEKTDEDEDNILIPIGGGVLVRGKTESPKNVIVKIGLDLAVEKSIPGAVEMLDRRCEGFEKTFENVEEKYNQVLEKEKVTVAHIKKLESLHNHKMK